MSSSNPNQSAGNNTEENLRKIQEILTNVQKSGDELMASIQELIEWTDYDVSQLNDYLKRIGNFLHEVIAAHPKTYTLAELSDKLKLDEATLRKLLNNVGTEIDAHQVDPAESVTEQALIHLLADRAGSQEGDRLAELLRGEGSYITWS